MKISAAQLGYLIEGIDWRMHARQRRRVDVHADVSSERKERQSLDQLEMQLEDAEADATEDELESERSSSSTIVKTFERRRPGRKAFPEHLPRERVVIAAPLSCPCCGSTKLRRRMGAHDQGRGAWRRQSPTPSIRV